MPDRQSSPGEVTARPETDTTAKGNGARPEASGQRSAASAADTNGSTRVAEQVADQVAAEQQAVEPGPVDPADESPAGDEVVVDGATAVEITSPATSQSATSQSATPQAEGPPPGPVSSANDAPTGQPASADGAGPTADRDVQAPDAAVSSVEQAPPADAAPAATAPQASGAADTPREPHGPTSGDTPVAGSEPSAAPGRPEGPSTSGPGVTVAATPAAATPAEATTAATDRDAKTAEEADTATAAAAGTAPAQVESTIPTPAPASPNPARPRPRPRPAAAADQGPAEDDGESPTVRTPRAAPGVAAVAGEAPTIAVRPTHDGLGSWFSSVDTEATQIIPRTAVAAAAADQAPAAEPARAADPPTERIRLAAAPGGAPPGDAPPDDGTGSAGRPPRRRLLVVAGVVALLALLYIGDLVLSSGSVPRGVTVAGVSVGGLGIDEAERRLRGEIEPRTSRSIAVTVGEATSEIDPAAAGLSVDWSGTLAQAGSQPLNPITRLTSFFTEREVGVVTTTDRPALDAALAELVPIVDRAPVEGSVRFEGSTPVPVNPLPGQHLDVPAAAEVLQRDWATGGVVTLPLTALPPTTSPEDVTTAIDQVARPAVSGPVTVVGEGGTQGTITPAVIASALSFRADAGALVPEINLAAVQDALKPQLAASERPGRDASLDFSSGAAVVIPSQDGRGVDYEASLKDLLAVLTGTGPRRIVAVYADQPAELTTEKLNSLGISGVIGEFQTGGFAADSGRNIKRAAEQINGRILQPGETFSLNGATNPRDAAHGYVEAGIIEDGHPSRGVGGGVSQVATTLYNASYFAGMTNVEHKEHSFYISRYPAGREATVFDNIIDLKFRNDNPTAVMIQTAWTPSSLTVRIFGTKRYEVTSTTGPRTNPTEPKVVTIPPGQPCSPSQGAPGFTVTDTRTLREISTGQVRNETRTVRYNPSPVVVCGG